MEFDAGIFRETNSDKPSTEGIAGKFFLQECFRWIDPDISFGDPSCLTPDKVTEQRYLTQSEAFVVRKYYESPLYAKCEDGEQVMA